VSDDANPLALRLDEFLNQYMRNNRIWFICAFQSISQLDEQLRNTILSLGNLVVGRATMANARVLADMVWKKNPWMVKDYSEEWRDEQHYNWVRFGNGYYRETRTQSVLVAWEVISYLTLEEQCELLAQKIEALQTFEFFLRPAVREGTVSQDVIPISIECLVRDSITGEYQFPNDDLIAKYRALLAARGGIPAETIRAEQEKRLATPITPQPRQGKSDFQPEERPRKPPMQPAAKPAPVVSDATPATAEEVRESQPFRLPDVAPVSAPPQTNPRSTKKTQSLPTLDDKEHAFLTFITEHPDTPVSVVYKGLGVGVALGTKIRDSLKAQGLVEELEIRTNSASGGRPTKCLIPTFAALELFGKEAPTGRGGILHRHVQQVVAKGARAKGYIAKVEYALSSGAIVDVHLENREQRIAVEIAIASTPEREISHIRNCLAASYAHVYTIFADEHLLGRTAMVMQNAFSAEELGKIRLLPLQQLAQVI
jgi:hypothetical protein